MQFTWSEFFIHLGLNLLKLLSYRSVWISNKSAKMFTLHSTKWYAAAFALRQRMLNFVQNFEYYMMFEVIEPNWHLFQGNMESVSSLGSITRGGGGGKKEIK